MQIGPLDTASGTLSFAFRNNTSESISHVDWTATARSGGSIAATGSSQGTTPAQLQPGEAGLSYIYFDNAEAIPADAEYEFQVSTSAADTSPYNTAPLTATEANVSGDSIVGSATNGTGAETTGPYSVEVYCFEGDTLSYPALSPSPSRPMKSRTAELSRSQRTCSAIPAQPSSSASAATSLSTASPRMPR